MVLERRGRDDGGSREGGRGRQGDGASYLMGHAAYILAFTPDDSAHVIYPSGVRQADWAHDLPLLVSGDWKLPSP